MSNLTPLRRRIYIVVLGLLGVLLASVVFVVLKHTKVILKRTRVLEPDISEEIKQQQLEQAAARPGRPNTLIIGDSFLLTSWPFKRVLGRDLTAYLENRGVNAVLSAKSGTGPHRYSSEALKLLPLLRPKLVIVFFFVGNDVTDTMRNFNLKPPPPQRCFCNIEDTNYNDFDWAMMKRCGVAVDVVEMAERAQSDPDSSGVQPINPHLICASLEYPQLFRANLALKGPGAREAWQANEALLRLIQGEVRHFGGELHLVAIPAALQIDPVYAKFLRKMKFKVNDALTHSREPQQRLKALCEREKIGYLDLLPAFLASPKRNQLYFKYDDHFRSAGHDLAYKLVVERIFEPWLARRN